MHFNDEKHYFETTYRTGADIWSGHNHASYLHTLTDQLSPNAFILDIGAGRGHVAYYLGKLGFKVIGLEYVSDIVKKNNLEVKDRKLDGKVGFIEGSALDIPLADNSFDAVTDIATLHHLPHSERETYAREVSRVLKPDGYLFLMELSRDNLTYKSWNPKESSTGDFLFENIVPYHFFTFDEIKNLFPNFTVLSSHTDTTSDGMYLSVLLKKK